MPSALVGVNFAGNDGFVGKTLWATPQATDYYLSLGMNGFRIMTLWETLQPELNGPLDESAITGLDGVVSRVTAAGAYAIVDLHNFGRRRVGGANGKLYVIGETSEVTAENFADFWGKFAARYRANPRVIFELTNEPHDQNSDILVDTFNLAIKAIRNAGAANTIMIDGNTYSEGAQWLRPYDRSVPNAVSMLRVADPLNRLIFDVHEYFDGQGGGRTQECMRGSGGARTLQSVTDWARTNGRRLFLGETGIGANGACYSELRRELSFLKANKDVWIGWSYFAALAGQPPYNQGQPWWYDIDPANFSKPRDDPRTTVLREFIPF